MQYFVACDLSQTR